MTTTTIRVAINGAKGKMGMQAVAAVKNDPELTLVGTFDHHDDLIDCIQQSKANVVVDFTTAKFAFQNTQNIIDAGAHPVIGTTGFEAEQIKILQQKSLEKKLGGIIAPNFSIGAILMMHAALQCIKHLPNVEIIEMHHDKKADAPSGTAIKTAELLSAKAKEPAVSAELIAGARGALCQHIPIHSVRLPGLVAHQQVIFGGTGETLTIRHDTTSREAFMPGVIFACKKVLTLTELVYGLENILFNE